MDDFRNKQVTVFGLGNFGGGVAVCRWLLDQGAIVLVSDQSPAEKLEESIAALAGLPIQFHLAGDQTESDCTSADLIVASPAIPPAHPFLLAARKAGVPITTEICLFVQRCKAKIIGVTGTKGKSTTSTLLHKMLETKHRTWFGGNIGKSLLADLSSIQPTDLVILELSSFMLEHLAAIQWSPHMAVVTMISIDHLDWHGSEEKYIDAKRNIVRFQTPADFAVLNLENPSAKSFSDCTRAQVIGYTRSTTPPFELQLVGAHNQLNAQAAFAAASLFGVDRATAQIVASQFTGLPHRLQKICEIDGVTFINDSISTLPEAAIAALNAFPAGKVIQIVGGSDKKDLPIDLLCQALTARAKAVLCIGKIADRLMATLPASIAHHSGNLNNAVTLAKQLTTPGDIVLLSPGHPSYDQFRNFESRGDAFVTAVMQLTQAPAAG